MLKKTYFLFLCLLKGSLLAFKDKHQFKVKKLKKKKVFKAMSFLITSDKIDFKS